ncbi:MAG: phosphoenolpyruvate carboxylase [Deltaproteobacteria bacterium]|nr:phosphoenolpyruvate carboxylase [Candidatus Zymogenaceae bacterium]
MISIPRCMSTQHPDNVTSPFFAESPELGGEDEVQEAYYAYSHLDCDEQMWDCEGKEVDNYVVKKLLTRYDSFFKEHRLGKDLFLTLRVPNPTVEKAEAKVLLETLESIPRSYDAAHLFYDQDIAPIFEVILPMTASTRCIDRIYRYYTDFIIKRQESPFRKGDIRIREWIGQFKPDRINVIPLFEERDKMLTAHRMVGEYLSDKPDVSHQRVFLARSDPAMNYGLVAAVLFNKIALMHLSALSDQTGIDIYPIIGVGSAPFRGNLAPHTVRRVIEEYPSAHTFTIQSSFKYDHPPQTVVEAVRLLRDRKTGNPMPVDEKQCLGVIDRYSARFSQAIVALAPIINEVAAHVPERRKRKLHIGLFGYSRETAGVKLPRAIRFTAALYSIGIPPELLALSALTKDDLALIREFYIHLDNDIWDALRYFNPDSPFLPEGVSTFLGPYAGDVSPDPEHKELTDRITSQLKEGKTGNISGHVLAAANIRGFLG